MPVLLTLTVLVASKVRFLAGSSTCRKLLTRSYWPVGTGRS